MSPDAAREPAGAVAALRTAIAARWAPLLRRHDTLLLRRAPAEPGAVPAGMALFRLREAAVVDRACAAVGHPTPPGRIGQRLAAGLELLLLERDGRPLATTWVVRGCRYLDEFALGLPIAPGETWVRDVWVAPPARGQGVFGVLVAAMAVLDDGGPHAVWSDVDVPETASRRAHARAGFEVVGRISGWAAAGGWCWRSRVPPWPLPLEPEDACRRLVRLRGARLARHQASIA